MKKNGLQKAYITLRLKEIRDKIISTEKIEGIEVTCEEHDFWNDNYRKILEETKKIYEDDQTAKQELFEIEQSERQAKLLEEEQQKQQEEENSKILGSCVAIFFMFVYAIFSVYCFSTHKILQYIVVTISLSILLSIITALIKLFKD